MHDLRWDFYILIVILSAGLEHAAREGRDSDVSKLRGLLRCGNTRDCDLNAGSLGRFLDLHLLQTRLCGRVMMLFAFLLVRSHRYDAYGLSSTVQLNDFLFV